MLALRLDSAAFRQSRPMLLTTFTNKMGSIGLSLVPILLVDRGVSTGEGTFVLAALKVMVVVGTLVGGTLSDRFSSRTLVLTALLLSACGLGLLPFQRTPWLILACGILAQLAEALINVVQRIFLMEQVDAPHQKEALGWMRMVNNFAQIFSYGIAAGAARLGVAPLMVFDASTSLGAFFVGGKILPRSAAQADSDHGFGAVGEKSRAAFFGCAVVLMGWSFLYEMFLQGGAGRLETLHPGEGLRRFSSMMVLNTVLCALFAVHASRFFRESWSAITTGLALMTLGILTAVWGMAGQGWVMAGMLLISAGEIILGALAQYTLMRLTPSRGNAGFYYSLGLTLAQCGRIAGAALAFPLLIHAPDPRPFTALVAGSFLFLLAVLVALRPAMRSSP